MFHYIGMFITGIIVGIIARFVYPGPVPMSWLMSGVLGIAGSLLGGTVMGLINKPADGSVIHPAGLITSVLGAMLLIFVCRSVLHLNF